MSTWKPVWGGVEDYEGNPLTLVGTSEWGVVPRTAFDALLAVAKAADRTYEVDERDFCVLCDSVWPGHSETCPIVLLDTQHPGWHDWK